MNVLTATMEPAERLAMEGPLAASVEQLRLRSYLSLILGDIVALLGGFTLAGLIYTGLVFESRAMLEAQLLLPLFLTIALYNRTYSIAALVDLRKSIGNMILALLVSAGLLNFL